MPDDLRPQAEALPDLVRLMGWPVLGDSASGSGRRYRHALAAMAGEAGLERGGVHRR